MSSMSTPRYERKLSPTERYSLVINELYRYNVIAIAEGEGDISLERLRDAVERASAANPGARVRLKSFLGFSKWVDSGIAPVVQEIQAPEWDGFSERGAEFMDGAFTPLNGGPICDVTLVKGQPLRIVFRVLHAAMDARGVQHWAKDIFRALRGEALVGSNSTLTDTDVVEKHKQSIAETPERHSCIPIIPPSGGERGPLRYIWRRVKIDKNLSNLMPKMAVFLAQYARRQGEGDVGFTVPVDLRGLRADDVASTANLTGYLRVFVKPEDNAKNVMQRINQSVRNFADCFQPEALKIIPWLPVSLLVNKLRKDADRLLYTVTEDLPSGGLVSLGMFKAEEYCCPGFTATSCVGIPGSVGKMNVAILNHPDHTVLMISTPAAYNQDGQLDTLIEDFREFVGA